MEAQINENLLKKFNGYRASHRNRWLLKNHLELTDGEFILYELLIDISHFDHPEKKVFGTFNFFPDELEPLLRVKSRTIKDRFSSLMEKNLVHLVDKNRSLYRISTYSRFSCDKLRGGKASEFVTQEKDLPVSKIAKNIQANVNYLQEFADEELTNADKSSILESRALNLSKYSSKVDVGFSDEEEDLINNLLG